MRGQCWYKLLCYELVNQTIEISLLILMSYSLLHIQCHFFFLKSQCMIQFSRSLLPRSAEKTPTRLRLEIEIE